MLACLTVLTTLLALVETAATGSEVVYAPAFGVMAIFCGYSTIGLIRARIMVSSDGVTVRRAFRSQHFRAGEIDHVELGPASNGHMAVLHLRSGKRVRLPALSSTDREDSLTRLNTQIDEVNRVLSTLPE